MTQQTESGLNTQFVNIHTGRTISREQAISQIEKGNPTYSDYHIVKNPNGLDYVRSNPDGKAKNNLE
jgi:hypothetical protein